jgi:hypothetical protein
VRCDPNLRRINRATTIFPVEGVVKTFNMRLLTELATQEEDVVVGALDESMRLLRRAACPP